MIDQAIYNSHNLAKSVEGLEDGSYKAFDKDGKEITLDKNKVEAEVARLQAEYNSTQYQRDRAVAYPNIKDQLDMQYWDAVNGTTLWQEHIAEIKAKHPKE